MQVFDFDKTIYKRISSLEFAIEAIMKEPSLLKYSPLVVDTMVRYFTDKLNLEGINELVLDYIKVVTDRRELIDKISLTFWNENRLKRLNKNVLKLVNKEDVICSTSPSFIIDGVKNVIPTKNIITTTLDFDTGKLFLNYKENKVKRIKELYPNTIIDALYTDSYSDKPLMDISNNVFLVKGKRLRKIK